MHFRRFGSPDLCSTLSIVQRSNFSEEPCHSPVAKTPRARRIRGIPSLNARRSINRRGLRNSQNDLCRTFSILAPVVFVRVRMIGITIRTHSLFRSATWGLFVLFCVDRYAGSNASNSSPQPYSCNKTPCRRSYFPFSTSHLLQLSRLFWKSIWMLASSRAPVPRIPSNVP